MSPSVLGGAAAADAEGAAGAGGQEAARPVAQQGGPGPGPPEALRQQLRPRLEAGPRHGGAALAPAAPLPPPPRSSHMCAEDYINLRQNSTTTNNECFVYERPGRAKLF